MSTLQNDKTDEFLEHFGVMGMKWGVRKSKRETGISRSRQALVEKNTNMISFLKSVRSGEQRQKTKAFGESIIGKDQWEKNFQTTVKSLSSQNKRLVQKGRLSVADKMSILTQVSVADMFITQTPFKKKARSTTQKRTKTLTKKEAADMFKRWDEEAADMENWQVGR